MTINKSCKNIKDSIKRMVGILENIFNLDYSLKVNRSSVYLVL